MFDFFTHQFGFSLLVMAALIGIIMTTVAYCILAERKISAWLQDRKGPNRVGPGGLLQPLADGVKFLLKEDIISANVEKPLFILAPCVAFVVAMIGFAVIPWAGQVDLGGPVPLDVQVASVDVGLLYILAVGSLSVYGVVIGGWASNNKFSFYGAMRAAAMMLSYEIPMGLAIMIVVLTSGELRLENIVTTQIAGLSTGAGATTVGAWNVLLHPFTFLILLVTAFAETNRTPFDLAEAEQELVGGYQTEYSAMKMALFYLGEYAHMITASAFMAVLFFGGWELFPFSARLNWGWLNWLNESLSVPAMLCRFGILFGKVAAFIFFYMWIRWTLPRFRFDQLMRLAWRGLVPIGMGLLGVTVLLVYVGKPVSIWAPIGEFAVIAVVLAWLTVRRPVVTGRQVSMPPVRPATGARAM